jgi:predicted DNA-binding transcriptional regulator AlpA
MQSDVFIRSLKNNADASFFLYSGVIFAFCGISKRTVFALLSFHDFPAHASLAGLHLDYRGIVLQCQ